MRPINRMLRITASIIQTGLSDTLAFLKPGLDIAASASVVMSKEAVALLWRYKRHLMHVALLLHNPQSYLLASGAQYLVSSQT